MGRALLCLLPILIFPTSSNVSAQYLSLPEIQKVFERDTTITLQRSQVTISSYNYHHDGALVESIMITPMHRVFRFPAVMLIPGYGKTARDYIPVGIEMAKDGFVCLAVSQPGFGRSEGTPDWVGPRTIAALSHGYELLMREPFVDTTNIGVYGYSRGALAASLLAVKLGNIKAAAFCAGIYDFRRAYDETRIEGIRRNMETETGMTPEAIDARTSIAMMDELSCPVLILHGEDDENAPVGQAYALERRLRDLGKEYEITIVPDVGHNIGRQNLHYVYSFFRRKLIGTSKLIVRTENGTAAEKETTAQLDSLLEAFDLSKWIFTNKVIVKEGIRSRSHPVLTVATQHRDDPLLLTATFLHEQIHWFVKSRIGGRNIMQELMKKFSDVPVGLSEGGGHNRFSTYLHLNVCYHEYKAMEELFGEDTAKEALLRRDVYTWVYRTIFENKAYFEQLFEKYNYGI
ncbi:MAG: prolyl oligopeptidase family serine peptidase [bacterium]|nr:MAG: prolyl oligopeptidase family serine peptidase [bacterium]